MPSATDFRRAFGLDPGVRIGGSSAAAAGSKRRRGADDSQQSFELTSVQVGHEVLSQNERYAFPTTLLLAPVASAKAVRSSRTAAAAGRGARDAAAAALRQTLRDRHIVYSAYGSPYECAFELATLQLHEAVPSADDDDEKGVPPGCWRATVRGIAHRRRDMPTKAQQAQQRDAARLGAAAGDDEAAKRAAKEERARVRAEAKARGLRVVVSRFGSGVCASCGGAVEHGQLIARPAAADAAGKRGSWAHAACALQPRMPRRTRA